MFTKVLLPFFFVNFIVEISKILSGKDTATKYSSFDLTTTCKINTLIIFFYNVYLKLYDI